MKFHMPDQTTAICGASAHVARLAAGSLVALSAEVAASRLDAGLAIVRPPGHHALRAKSMGFCYLNNVAIATLEAQATGAKRVAVFDFDVHPGNGTQHDHAPSWIPKVFHRTGLRCLARGRFSRLQRNHRHSRGIRHQQGGQV